MVVLAALLTAVGGLVISQAAGGQSGIQATAYDDAVRFTVSKEKLAVLRAEVFNLSGKQLLDSGPVMGNALDWNMSMEAGERAAHGIYLYAVDFLIQLNLSLPNCPSIIGRKGYQRK